MKNWKQLLARFCVRAMSGVYVLLIFVRRKDFLQLFLLIRKTVDAQVCQLFC